MLTNRFSTRTIVLLVTAIALIALLTLKAYLGHGRAGMVDFHAASVGDAIPIGAVGPGVGVGWLGVGRR